MVNRKRDKGKHIYFTEDERRAADELKENIRLGLIAAPKDYDIFAEGIRSYNERLKAIKHELDSRPKKEFKRSDYKNVPQEMWDHLGTHDAQDKPFMNDYERKLAKLRGEKVQAFDQYGFKKYPREKPTGTPHPLDHIYGGHDAAPPTALLEYFTLSIESWYNLLESERLAIRQRWDEITRYPQQR